MDEINKQLKKLEELRTQMDAMSQLTDKLNDLDDHKAKLDELQVTWLDFFYTTGGKRRRKLIFRILCHATIN